MMLLLAGIQAITKAILSARSAISKSTPMLVLLTFFVRFGSNFTATNGRRTISGYPGF
ncbi:MAG: hypothetical protein ACXVA2_20115 [Mucilaginibacter sp.]